MSALSTIKSADAIFTDSAGFGLREDAETPRGGDTMLNVIITDLVDWSVKIDLLIIGGLRTCRPVDGAKHHMLSLQIAVD